MSLNGKVAAVTGGGSGIGEAACVRLAAEGARVAVIDIDEQSAALTAKLAGEGLAVVADVSDSAAVDAALAEVEAALGPVDVWVNNAGISGGEHSDRVNPRAEQQLAELAAGGEVTTALDAVARMTDEEWRRMLSVHLDGTFYGTRAAARSMAPRGAGVIVNVASICGIEGCTGHPHYSAAKGGILAFTRSVAKELIQQGIRVNAVAPGFVDTQLVSGSLTEPLIGAVVMGTPQGRLGRPEEIAATIAFLCSADAEFYVGATVSPNGGFVTV
jgi:3-oxoacyl-[acyl-carrier protein] reductase